MQGESQILESIRFGRIEEVYEHIKHGHDVNSYVGEHYRSALHAAVVFRQAGVVEMLLLNGADCSLQDTHGYTALHHAAIRGTVDIIRMLVLADAPIGCQNLRGRTALHYVAGNGSSSVDAVSILLDHATGDDVLIKDDKGKMAEYYSMNEEVAQLFQNEAIGAVQTHIDASRVEVQDDYVGFQRNQSMRLPGFAFEPEYSGRMPPQNHYAYTRDEDNSQDLCDNLMEDFDFSQGSQMSQFDLFDNLTHPVRYSYPRKLSTDSLDFLDDLKLEYPERYASDA